MDKIAFIGIEILAGLWACFCLMGVIFAIPGNPSPEQVAQLHRLNLVLMPSFFFIIPGLLIAAGILRFLSSTKMVWLLLGLAVLLPPIFLILALRILPR